jgi:hypothetical protein
MNLHEVSTDKRVTVVYIAHKKPVKSIMFPHHNIHKYTRTSLHGKRHNQTDHVLMDKRIQVQLMSDLLEELHVIDHH